MVESRPPPSCGAVYVDLEDERLIDSPGEICNCRSVPPRSLPHHLPLMAALDQHKTIIDRRRCAIKQRARASWGGGGERVLSTRTVPMGRLSNPSTMAMTTFFRGSIKLNLPFSSSRLTAQNVRRERM